MDKGGRAKGPPPPAGKGGRGGDRRARRFPRRCQPCARIRIESTRIESGPERADRREGPRAPQRGRQRYAGRVQRRRRQAPRQAHGRQEVLQARGREPRQGAGRRPLHSAHPRAGGDPTFLPDVRPPTGEAWRIERAADNADWKLAGIKPGEKLDTGRANAATYSLSLLELADVAPDDAKDTGLDNPTLVNATTLDGLSYEIKVGSLVGDNYFVRFSSSGSPAEAGGEAAGPDAERLKKLLERLPREKLLADYVLLVPNSKLEDTLKPRAELLQKKPEKKSRPRS